MTKRGPAIVAVFKVFYVNGQDLQTAVQISDSGLQEGQGQHGGLGRECTYNNMAAIGLDFKTRFVDRAPAGNADITPTLGRLMRLKLEPHGTLQGRVLEEALVNGAAAPAFRTERRLSPGANGRRMLLEYQELGAIRYLDSACFVPADQSPTSCR